MSVVGGLGCQCEIESMSRLRFVSVHHTDGVNELERRQTDRQKEVRDLSKPQCLHRPNQRLCWSFNQKTPHWRNFSQTAWLLIFTSWLFSQKSSRQVNIYLMWMTHFWQVKPCSSLEKVYCWDDRPKRVYLHLQVHAAAVTIDANTSHVLLARVPVSLWPTSAKLLACKCL